MKRYLVVAASLALALLLVACGGGSSSGPSAESAEASDQVFPELKWASTPVKRVDPVTSYDHATLSLVAPVAQGLMAFDKNGKVIPALATSMEEVSPTKYVYHLKSGVKFSDGSPLTMEDVLFSLHRNMSPTSQSASNYESVQAIKAAGSDAVEVILKKPDVTWPNVPAFAGQIIEKKAAVGGGLSKLGTQANLPVGTGPFKFISFSPDKGATLALNPYWSGPKPSMEKINVGFLKDDSALALAMRSGEVDGSFFITSKRPFEASGVQLLPGSGATEMALSMNVIVAPYNDIHLRKAIAYATDRKGMVESIFGGAAELTETLTPLALYPSIAPKEQVEASFSALPSYEFNLTKAKEELAKSNYPNGLSITFDAEPAAVKVAQVLAADLEKIGIHMSINQMTESSYLAMLFGPREKLGLTMGFYGATSPDPTSLLNYWLLPEQAKVNGLNSANYKNATVGSLVEEQSETKDGETRLKMIAELFGQMKEEVPYVPLFAPEQFMVLSEGFAMPEYSQWTTDGVPWPLLIKKPS